MKKLYLMPLLFLTACSTTKPPALVLQPEPPLPTTDNSAIRYPEVIRAYHVGRYVDPNDDLVMHEQHVVYRVEENSLWNLHPGPAGGSLGSPAPSYNAAFSRTPVNDAVLAEVNAQRLATVQIKLEAKTLAAALAQFQAALQQTKTNLQEMALLRVQVGAMQRQLNMLKAAQAQKAVPAVSLSTNQPPDGFFDTNSDEFNP
jgi:hypothetical protein